MLQAPSLRVTGGFYALQGACRRRSVRSARYRCGVRLAYAYARTDGHAVAYADSGDPHADAGAHLYSYSYADGHADAATNAYAHSHADGHPYAATNAYAIPSTADSNPIPSAADAHSVADRNTSTYRYAL